MFGSPSSSRSTSAIARHGAAASASGGGDSYEVYELGESADSPEEIADAIDEVIEETRQAANELVDLERLG
jgi:hypothetical protein